MLMCSSSPYHLDEQSDLHCFQINKNCGAILGKIQAAPEFCDVLYKALVQLSPQVNGCSQSKTFSQLLRMRDNILCVHVKNKALSMNTDATILVWTALRRSFPH